MVNCWKHTVTHQVKEFNKSKVSSEYLQCSQVPNLLQETVISGRPEGSPKDVYWVSCRYSPAATELSSFWGIKFFFIDSVSLGIADDQTESCNFVSVDHFKI